MSYYSEDLGAVAGVCLRKEPDITVTSGDNTLTDWAGVRRLDVD